MDTHAHCGHDRTFFGLTGFEAFFYAGLLQVLILENGALWAILARFSGMSEALSQPQLQR